MVYTDVKPEHKTKPSEDSVIASGSPKTTEQNHTKIGVISVRISPRNNQEQRSMLWRRLPRENEGRKRK